MLLPSAMQEDLCENSLAFTERCKRNICHRAAILLGSLRRGHSYRKYPWEQTEGGIFDLQPNGGQNYPTELTQNLAIRNDLAIPTESQAPSPSMLTPGSGERARRTAERGRQAERVAVAIFYNKTHLRVTTTTAAAATEEGTSSSVVDMAFELPARSRRGRTFGGREGPLPLPVAPNGEIASGRGP